MVMRECRSTGQYRQKQWARIIGMVESAALTVENALEESPENEKLEQLFIAVADALADLQEAIEGAAGGKIQGDEEGV